MHCDILWGANRPALFTCSWSSTPNIKEQLCCFRGFHHVCQRNWQMSHASFFVDSSPIHYLLYYIRHLGESYGKMVRIVWLFIPITYSWSCCTLKWFCFKICKKWLSLTLLRIKVWRTSCFPPAFEFWTSAEVGNDVVKGAKIQISLKTSVQLLWKFNSKYAAFYIIIPNFSCKMT